VNIIHFPKIPFEAKNGILTIGIFDGVHQGHQKLIDKMNELSHTIDASKTVVTFANHPRTFINPDKKVELLSLLEEKIELFEKKGIDYVCLLPFTEELSKHSAEEFIQKYLSMLSPKFLVVGREHYFGKDKVGTINTLRKFENSMNYQAIEVNECRLEGQEISSTAIRTLLKNGKVREASRLLGYNYSISGNVQHGLKIGNKIGYPTANISVDENKLIPAHGVYAVLTHVENCTYEGMLYIGNRPTIAENKLSIEINLFDFTGDLYHKKLKVEIIEKIRNDIKFNNTNELVAQINEDSKQIKQMLNSLKH